MKTTVTTLIICLGLITLSCKKTLEVATESENELIEITKAQYNLERMQLGEPKFVQFNELVHFTGSINVSAKGLAIMSLGISGLVQQVNCTAGEYVKKGQAIFLISGNDFIDLQKDYAESSAVITRLKSEHERMLALFEERVATEKDVILSESAYKAELARNTALKLKLEQLGLDVSVIEKNSFYASFSLKAPISGYVSLVNVSVGQIVDPNVALANIIDAKQFQLKLNIFEKDINKLKLGQHIEFNVGGSLEESFSAELTFMGKTINNNTKAVDCYAKIENLERLSVVNNQFVEGNIVVGSDSVFALPKTAIFKSDNNSYILILNTRSDSSYFFRKQIIEPGLTNKKYVELKGFTQQKNILLSGTYNVLID